MYSAERGNKGKTPRGSFQQSRLPAAPTSITHQSASRHPHLHLFQPLLPTGFIVLPETGEAGGEVEQMKGNGRIAACVQGWRAGTCDHCVKAGAPTGAAALLQNRRRVATTRFSSSVRHNKLRLLSGGRLDRRQTGAATSRTDVPHVEVDHVLGVGPLDRDGEGLEGVESEGHQASDRVVDRPPQQARLDLKLQQARVTSIKPVWGGRKRITSTCHGGRTEIP